MSLSFHAVVAERGFDVELEVADGERTAVLGPNGSGKSTLLGLIAGTLRPDAGRAILDGRELFSIGGSGRRWLPPHRRRIALLTQEPGLFPHLSVADNVAFGPRAAGRSKADAARSAERWLDEVGAHDLAGRHAHQLSGGQAQRVAIARALAAEPALLLLDEPMSALDVSVAPLVRRVLRRVLADRAAIVVTHDLVDAVLLSERVLVLDHGRVAEAGATGDVLRHPRARFTARLAGLNLLLGVRDGHAVRTPGGVLVTGVPVAGEDVRDGEPVAASFAPADVSVHLEAPGGSIRNSLAVTVAELEPLAGLVRVRADDGDGHLIAADVTAQSVAELDLYPGREVILAVKAAAVTIYPV